MPRSTVLLVNPNRMTPPIAPIGLEYLADWLLRAGHEPVPCDLAFEPQWEQALDAAIDAARPVAVGLSIRNLDDAYFASQDFILERTEPIARRIKEATGVPLILGGVGFSIAPREVMEFLGADYGIAGDEEDAMAELLDRIIAGNSVASVPGLVHRLPDRSVACNPPAPRELGPRSAPLRRFFDNHRYFDEGGQAGVETKRGCGQSCIYCVEPEAKGRAVRLRSPESVAAEFRDLLEQGIDVIHLCDSEFNLPPAHALAVCEAIVREGLGDRIHWYAYASPVGFDGDLAKAMARAGCVGINFGVDHADPAMLKRLGRTHGPGDIRRTAQACRDAGLALMFDMLLGSPGETCESIGRAIDLMQEVKPDRVGLSCGVRVYPNTPLGRRVQAAGPLARSPHLHGTVEGNDNLLRPIFYMDAGLGMDIHKIVWGLVGGDQRFLAADPSQMDRNYNYNDNSRLTEAIRDGVRGAYWDILRRLT